MDKEKELLNNVLIIHYKHGAALHKAGRGRATLEGVFYGKDPTGPRGGCNGYSVDAVQVWGAGWFPANFVYNLYTMIQELINLSQQEGRPLFVYEKELFTLAKYRGADFPARWESLKKKVTKEGLKQLKEKKKRAGGL
jgi:hypothetical protein